MAAAMTGPRPPAAAQGSRACFVVVDRTGGQGRQVDVGGGFFRVFQGGGIWAHCRGQDTRWYSDSVAWYQDFDRFDMIGNVRFEDATVELTSERASYHLNVERLDARGNARLRNRVTGSVLRGPRLTYHRRVPGIRDTTLLAAGGRPTIEYRSERDSAGAEPYIILADSVQFRGNSAATAWGTVTIDRSDFHAAADSATLDTEVGRGRLMRSARITGGDSAYTLVGRDIQYRLTDRTLTWIQAEGDASAVSAEWLVVADTVAFDVEDDRIQAGQAWGDSSRSRAISATNTITADSLAIDAPRQTLREVRGIGDAVARSLLDSLDADADWIAGDTVVAAFGRAAEGGSTLDGIVAVGRARARYRVFPEAAPEGPPDLSYSRGDRITARFAENRLVRVDIVGATDGVYLEAQRRRSP
jgi:lipopolysaccharide export system protein LptA